MLLAKRTRGFKRVVGIAVAMSATTFLPAAAVAQNGAAGALLEEIVTVARKRSSAEAVQDVPVAVNAFGAEQIDALFVKKLEDLSYLMPNVQLESVGTFPGVQNFSIRGQGINSSIPSVDPTVGVFIDGIYMGTTYGVVIDTFDLEAVEVLRGPQGLLFGRNVTGGAVVIRNARPTGDFGLRVRAGATDAEQVNLALALEGSLVDDKLAAKVVFLYDDDNGYYDSLNQDLATSPAPHPLQPFYVAPADGDNVGALETTLVRPTLVWTPSDRSEWVLSVETGTTEGDGAAWANVTEQRAGILDEFATMEDEKGFTEIDWTQVMLETNIAAIGNGTLTNIVGWREVNAESAADVDGTDLPIFAAPGYTDQDQISNELRWSGSFSDSWEATIGAYYFDQSIDYKEARYIWLPPPLGPAPLGVNLQRALGGDMDSDNFGLFWSNDFHLNNAWTITAGIRYTDESKSANIIVAGCTDNITFDCAALDLSGDWSNTTPKIGAQYRVDDDTQIYGFWSKGYRSGGFNFRNAVPDLIPPGPTNEEENNTYEVGFKTEFNDGKMRLNVAAFYNDIDDMQRELNMRHPVVVVLQGTVNAGDVTIKGIEMDFAALLTDSFSLTASYGWQDGEYDSINPMIPAMQEALRQAGVLGPTDVLIGEELPRLAPTNYSIGFSWDIPLGKGLVNVQANHSFRERHPYDDANNQFFDDQRRTNASINWFSGDDQWKVSLYGKNLEDEANWGNLTSIAGLWTAGPMKKGRLLGLEVNFNYE